jgi:hypothetical protein
MAGGSEQLLADLLSQVAPVIDATPYDPTRFT